MKRFSSFKEALSYRTRCPVCTSKLDVNCRDLVLEYSLFNPVQKMTFELGNGDDMLHVYPETERIELIISQRKQEIFGHSNAYSGGNSHSVYFSYDGMFGHSLTVECKDCCQYSFTLQIWADLKKCVLTDRLLNSEFISWDDKKGITHEIKTIYATNKTQYTYYDSETGGSDKTITLPLISIDVEHPEDAISRIRNLLVFS